MTSWPCGKSVPTRPSPPATAAPRGLTSRYRRVQTPRKRERGRVISASSCPVKGRENPRSGIPAKKRDSNQDSSGAVKGRQVAVIRRRRNRLCHCRCANHCDYAALDKEPLFLAMTLCPARASGLGGHHRGYHCFATIGVENSAIEMYSPLDAGSNTTFNFNFTILSRATHVRLLSSVSASALSLSCSHFLFAPPRPTPQQRVQHPREQKKGEKGPNKHATANDVCAARRIKVHENCAA